MHCSTRRLGCLCSTRTSRPKNHASVCIPSGYGCIGKGDLKTAIAMKICDILGMGGSYAELVVVDYVDGTILLGHDGPFHIAIAEGKPILRGMGLYHGKQGTGVSVLFYLLMGVRR
jgi:L-arabinose isomerase